MSDVVLQVSFSGLLLKGDGGEWISLLVFIVVIALSAVSSIVRARKQKKDLEREERPVSRPSAGYVRRQEVSRAVQEGQQLASRAIRPAQGSAGGREDLGRAKPRSIIRPSSALGTFVAEIKAEIKRAADEMQGRTPPTQCPAPAPEPQQPAKVALPAIESPPTQHFVRAKPQEEVDDLSEIVPEFSGPDDLRRAIVYYEIFGKAVSLRGPEDHLIGL